MTDAATTNDNAETTTEAPAVSVDVRAAAAAAAKQALIEGGAIPDDSAEPEAAADPAAATPAAEKAPKRGPDGKFLKPDSETPAEQGPPKNENRLAVELRARQNAQRTREAAEAEARAIVEQARRERAEAERMRQEYEPYRRAAEAFQKDPQMGIRELAAVTRRPTRELVDGLLVEGAPDPVRDLGREVESMKAENRALKEQLQQWQQQQAQERQATHAQSLTREFLSTVAAGAADKYPLLNSVYEDDVPTLIAKANQVHREYFERTGKYATWDDLAEYLESLEQSKASKYTSATSRQAAGAKPRPGGRANGHSPIAAATAARRASGPTPPEHMTDEERRQAAIEAGQKALREYRGGGA